MIHSIINLLLGIITIRVMSIESSSNQTYIDWTKIGLEIHNISSCLPEQILCNASSPSEFPRHCQCDSECWKYGDCCLDAAEKAWNQGKIVTKQQWTCEKLPTKPSEPDIYLYMISECPENYPDSYTGSMCRRNVSDLFQYWYVLDIPVMSKTSGKIYINVFCAICNNDFQLSDTALEFHCNVEKCLNLIARGKYVPQDRYWHAHYTNSSGHTITENIFFSLPSFENFTQIKNHSFRLCEETLEDCSHKKASDLDRIKCRLFSAHVFNISAKLYKNHFCAKCNNQTNKKFQCVQVTPASFSPGGKIHSFAAPSYSVLLDFSSLTSDVDRTHHGCESGEVFDPLQKQCAQFYCSTGYKKQKNVCVPVNSPVTTDHPFENGTSDYGGNSLLRSRISNPNCRRVMHENFTIFPNESILIDSVFDQMFRIGEYEQLNETAVLVCVPDEVFCPSKYSIIQRIVTIICLPVSLICLTIHVIATIVMRKYRNLPGKNILSLSIMLFLAQLLFVFIDSIENRIFCYIFAAVVHFCFLSTFFWVNILAADLCRNLFNPQNWKDGANHFKTYSCYAAYAWLFPLLIVSLALVVDNTSILPELRPKYGIRLCWFTKAYALLLFFAAPLAILLVENVIFFAVTAHRIYKSTKAANRLRARRERTQLFLYVKLAFIMGLTWGIGFVASLVNYEPLWIAFIVLNALQGTFVFIAFTLKRDFIQKLSDFFLTKYRKWQLNSSKRDDSSSTNTLPSIVSQTTSASAQ